MYQIHLVYCLCVMREKLELLRSKIMRFWKAKSMRKWGWCAKTIQQQYKLMNPHSFFSSNSLPLFLSRSEEEIVLLTGESVCIHFYRTVFRWYTIQNHIEYVAIQPYLHRRQTNVCVKMRVEKWEQPLSSSKMRVHTSNLCWNWEFFADTHTTYKWWWEDRTRTQRWIILSYDIWLMPIWV